MNQRRSFFYKNSRIYLTLLKLVHGKTFAARYRYMAQQIGKGKSVLEPGSGPGVIAPFLDPTSTYRGFDLNTEFVKDANKRGINVVFGNVIDGKMYPECDAAVLIDILHHLRPENQKTLLRNTLKAVKTMVIICEPYEHRHPALNKIPGFSVFMNKFFNYIEQDGNNEAKSDHVHSQNILRQDMEKGFGVIPEKTKKEIIVLGQDLIATYHLRR